MSTVKTYYTTNKCDACQRVDEKAEGWYRIRTRFVLDAARGTYYRPSNGELNDLLNNQPWTFCSTKCAETFRASLITIEKVGA